MASVFSSVTPDSVIVSVCALAPVMISRLSPDDTRCIDPKSSSQNRVSAPTSLARKKAKASYLLSSASRLGLPAVSREQRKRMTDFSRLRNRPKFGSVDGIHRASVSCQPNVLS